MAKAMSLAAYNSTGLRDCENTCLSIELSEGVQWTSPNPFSYEEKGRNCAIFKVPLFLREGFRVRSSLYI
jgi:hypothetical protein